MCNLRSRAGWALARTTTHQRSFCTRPSDSRLSRRQLDADKLSAQDMAGLARWTDLIEKTFLSILCQA
jgi:hypothetical protein